MARTELVSEFNSEDERVSEVLGSYSTKVVFATLVRDGTAWQSRVWQFDVETEELQPLLPEVQGAIRSAIFAPDFFALH